jgi:phosphatidylglycerophosphate synthase
VVGLAVVLALRGIAQVNLQGSPGGAAAPLIGPRVRAWYQAVLHPFEDWLVGVGVPADLLTYAQLVVSVLAGLAFWQAATFLAGWLTILAGTLDVLDGGVARRTRGATARGSLIDSVADRWAEFATFVGLGALFRDGWVLLAVAVAAFASQMVSYTRARAEALGLSMELGRAQRPERYVLLGLGACLSGLVAHLACPVLGFRTHAVLAATVVALAVVATWTALERVWHAARTLAGDSTRQ